MAAYRYKNVTLVMGHKGHAKKFAKYMEQGWEVVSQTKVGAFGSRTAFVLRRPK